MAESLSGRPPRGPALTRREALVAGGLALGAVAIGVGTPERRAGASPDGGLQPASTTVRFRSRPDLHPPLVRVEGPAAGGTGDYVFVSPAGPMIVDADGDLVWNRPVPHWAMDLQVQRYRGEPVLTWWQGTIQDGVGEVGEVVVVDARYQQVARVVAANGLRTDFHEFAIAPDGTAYLTAYQLITADLSAVDGPEHGKMLEAWIQGIDLSTGDLVFEWRSSDHIDLSETYSGYLASEPFFTPVHLNSIDLLPDGNLLVSGRWTSTIYKVDRATGEILWRLGGKKSDFSLGPGVHFAFQHDARWHPGNVLSMFDNESAPPQAKQSRGLVLHVTEKKRTATFLHAYTYPGVLLLCGSQGSVQFMPNGDVFVGWGSQPYFTQYRHDGKPVLAGRFENGTSYRAFRLPWTGTPAERPAIAVERPSKDALRVYASWNGATEVARWSVIGGPSRRSLTELGTAARAGFETTIEVSAPAGVRFVAARALDRAGRALATSPVEKV